MFSIIIATLVFFNRKTEKENNSLELFELSFYLMFFAITTKFMYSMYSIIPLLIAFKIFGIPKMILHFFNKKIFICWNIYFYFIIFL